MSEIPNVTGEMPLEFGAIGYTARVVKCGDSLVIEVSPKFIRNWGLKAGDWVIVRMNYIGPLDEKAWLEALKSLGIRGDNARNPHSRRVSLGAIFLDLYTGRKALITTE